MVAFVFLRSTQAAADVSQFDIFTSMNLPTFEPENI